MQRAYNMLPKGSGRSGATLKGVHLGHPPTARHTPRYPMSSRPALPSPRQLRRQVQTSKAGLSREGTGRWPGALMHARSMPVHTGHRPSTGPAGPSDPGHSSHSRAPSAGPGPDQQMVPSHRDSDRRAPPARRTRPREAPGRRGRAELSEPSRLFRSLSDDNVAVAFGVFIPLSEPFRRFQSLFTAFGAFPSLSEPSLGDRGPWAFGRVPLKM